MKICLIGGHLAPAQAVIDYLPKDWQVIFIGRKQTFEGDTSFSMEYITITNQGILFYPLITGRIQRRITKHTLKNLPKIPRGFFQALQILRRERPDVVLGFGGYLSLPVALAARTLKIPVIIHEQTLKAGMANAIIGKFAKQIYISWQTSAAYFPRNKTILIGNLLRKTITDTLVIARSRRSEAIRNEIAILPSLYITGGSGGSHFINQLVEQVLPKLLEKYIVIHQTGDAMEFNDYDRLVQYKNTLSEKLKKRYTLKKFILPNEIGEVLNSSDVVIARSGMNTVTELIVMKKPGILIPLEVGQKNEQMDNAVFLKNLGLGIILSQKFATGESLVSAIDDVVDRLEEFSLKNDLDSQIHLHASEHLIELLKFEYEKTESKKS